MKKALTAAAVLLLVGLSPRNVSAAADFVLDLQPLALLVSSRADDFSATRTSGAVTDTEEIGGASSHMPGVRAGVGVRSPGAFIDFTGGVGMLWNDKFLAPYFRTDVAFRFDVGRNATLGPHAGVILFANPQWTGDADIQMSNDSGFIGGIDLSIGRRERGVSFLVSADYLGGVRFPVKGEGGWVVDRDRLDISGVALQFGALLRY